MKHLAALCTKFIITFLILEVILGAIYDWPLGTIVLISAVIAVVGYYVGDLRLLPIGSNLTASSVDFGLSFIACWGIGSLFFNEPVYTTGPLFASLVLAVEEWFFHLYVMPRIIRVNNNGESYV